MTLTAIIIAPPSFLDSPFLKRTEESVSFADEIIIDRTTDRIANFAAARNNALKKTHGEWVLFLDADEELSQPLAVEIQRVLHQSLITNYPASSADRQSPVGFMIPRQDYFLGRWLQHGETGHVRLLRLARRGAGQWVRPVHERWVVQGPVGTLRHPLFHRPHGSIISMLGKIDRYAKMEAAYRQNQGADRRWRMIIEMVVLPKLKFFQNYVLRYGFLDGVPGLFMALMMSFHSFLVRTYQVDAYRHPAKRS